MLWQSRVAEPRAFAAVLKTLAKARRIFFGRRAILQQQRGREQENTGSVFITLVSATAGYNQCMAILVVLLVILLEPAMTTAPISWTPASGELRKLAGGLMFCEGPVWTDKQGGYLIFSDIPASELKRWTEKDGLTVYRANAEHTNGNARTPDGQLVSCQHGTREVVREGEAGKPPGVIAEKWQDKRFNSPNDVVVTTAGVCYFTDPTYGLQNEARDRKKEMDTAAVYRLDLKTQKIDRVAAAFDQPNGLCLSPDEGILYVADSGKPHHIKAFDVKSDGTLGPARVLAVIEKGAPDGIRCDADGRVWSSAGDGVDVFSPDGKLVGKIAVPETPANLCFGGGGWKTLFITARTGLYAIDVNATIPANLKR